MEKIVYSYDSEIRRILYTLEKVKSNFYQSNNFLLLDLKAPRIAGAVCLPRFPHQLNEELLSEINSQVTPYLDSKHEVKLPKKVRDELIENIHTLMLSDEEVAAFKKSWLSVKSKFYGAVETIFDLSGIDFTICPTRFGTGGSTITQDEASKKVLLYFNIDSDISSLASIMLMSLFSLDGFRGSKELWRQRQVMVDYLFSKTKLVDIFPKRKTTMLSALDKVVQDTSIVEMSNEFYNYLGYPVSGVITLDGETVKVNGIEADLNRYSPVHVLLVKYFLQNADRILSYEELAKVIWGDKWVSKYSIWALSKHISYLRRMLKDLGINPNRIQTYKKKGFLFK